MELINLNITIKMHILKLLKRQRNMLNGLFKVFIIYIFITLIQTQTIAHEPVIPMSSQIPILMKVISFERKLVNSKDINILVLYQSKYAESLLYAKESAEIINKADPKFFGNIKYNAKLINLDNTSDISSHLTDSKHSVALLMPLRAVNVAGIIKQCHSKKVLTLTTYPAYLDYGAIVGIEERRTKPEIWINLAIANANGLEFSSQLLKLVKIKV